jgi:hypothetical protein
MQYMLMIYSDPATDPAFGSPAFDTMMQGYRSFTERLRTDGVMRGGEELQPATTATSVRMRGGKAETMDGPFATTKEHLGGFYLIDVPDLDAALRYAAMIPSAAWGTVEVRPVVVYG